MESTCPISLSGEHEKEWVFVPESVFYRDNGGFSIPAHEKGFCRDCGEQFSR